MRAGVAQPDIAQPTIPGKEEEKDVTDLLEERPVQRASIITGDIASEAAAADPDSLIVRSGEGYDREQASVPESPPILYKGSAAEGAESVLPLIDLSQPTDAEDAGSVQAPDVQTPDEPPDVYSRFHGLGVMPHSGLCVAPE